METRTQEWLTVLEVAKHLRIPRSRAYELIQGGELLAVRIGERSIRVNRRELERFLLPHEGGQVIHVTCARAEKTLYCSHR